MDILLFPLVILVTLMPIAAITAIIAYSNNQRKAQKQRRAKAMANIAAKLGADEHRAEHQELVPHIKRLMEGQRQATVSNSLRFNVGNGEVILAEYSCQIYDSSPLSITPGGSILSSRRLTINLIAIPILDTMKDVPLFYIQRKRAFDGLPYLNGWRRVRLAKQGGFNQQMGIKTKRHEMKAAQSFFEQHPELIEFCQDNRDYHVVSNGHWLAIYKPNQYLRTEIDLFRHQLDLAKQFYGCIWSVEEDGKAAVFDNFLDTSEADFWSDSPDSYDNHLKSLKEQ